MKGFRNWVRDEQGAVALWIAGGMVTVLGIGALGVDVGNLYVQESRLRIAADSAVLAAARELNNGTAAVKAAAQDYTEKNLPAVTYGTVLAPTDVEVGIWNADTLAFSSGGVTPNAVQLTLRRTASNGNPVDTLFAAAVGYQDMDIELTVVAARPEGFGDCLVNRGFIAGEKISFGQNADLGSGMCAYGRLSVQFGQDAVLADGSKVGALDVNNITFGQNPTIPPDALVEADVTPDAAINISSILDDWELGNNLPPQITNVVTGSTLPATLDPGTAYIVDQAISIDQDVTLTDVIIATRENISFGQNGRVRNSAGTCNTPAGGNAIGLYAVKNIAIGQDGVAIGVQFVAGETATIGQDLGAFNATVQAGKDIIIGQDPGLTACASSIDGVSGAGGLASAVLVK